MPLNDVSVLHVATRGKTFDVEPAGHASFWEALGGGTWEPETFRIFDRFLSPDHSYIDIGAWIGPTVLYGSRTARVAYGLEPDPIAYAELERNVAVNRDCATNIKLFNACIATRSGEVSLGSRGAGGDSTSSLLFAHKKTHWTVKAFSFADFIEQNRIADCNFIKMDIEGGEYKILPTMAAYLKRHRPTLHLSLHPCYLKWRPLGWPGRVMARLVATVRLLRSIDFYRHIYDHNGCELTPARLLWLSRSNTSLDVVLTDQEWHSSP
jgi:FkbM family methyltransferase